MGVALFEAVVGAGCAPTAAGELLACAHVRETQNE